MLEMGGFWFKRGDLGLRLRVYILKVSKLGGYVDKFIKDFKKYNVLFWISFLSLCCFISAYRATDAGMSLDDALIIGIASTFIGGLLLAIFMGIFVRYNGLYKIYRLLVPKKSKMEQAEEARNFLIQELAIWNNVLKEAKQSEQKDNK
jgi:hypothetical protein